MSIPTALEQVALLRQAGNLDEAVIALEGLLAQHPDHALALAQLADLQLRRGRLQEAGAALDRAEAAGGVTAVIARLRGDVHYRSRRWREAAVAYQQAGALGQWGTWTLLQLARCRLRLADPVGAKGAIASALERDPGSAPAWVLLGDLAVRAGDLDEAERMFARAHEHAPADQFAYAKLVETRLLRLPEDRRDREIEVLLKSTGRDNRHLLGVLARLHSKRQDDEGAAGVWHRRAELPGGDSYARKMEGYALRRAGRLAEAAPLLRAALLAEPEDLILFRTYVHTEHSRGALDDLRQALEQLLPLAGTRRGAVFGELRKLGAL
ncbi:MAG: tetratricopeptide repeat protein [Mycobacteriales bacterium]